MGVLDDLGKAFEFGKKIAGEAMDVRNTCAQVSLSCPCGLEQTFSLKEWTPEQLTEVIKAHASTCDKASGGP
jgi:hypothetical protein